MRKLAITGLVALTLLGCGVNYDEASRERGKKVSEITSYLKRTGKLIHFSTSIGSYTLSTDIEVAAGPNYVYYVSRNMEVYYYPNGKVRVNNKTRADSPEIKDAVTIEHAKRIGDLVVDNILMDIARQK